MTVTRKKWFSNSKRDILEGISKIDVKLRYYNSERENFEENNFSDKHYIQSPRGEGFWFLFQIERTELVKGNFLIFA